MSTSWLSRFVRIAVIASMGLALAGCSSGPSGKYLNSTGSFEVEFKSGRAFIMLPQGAVPADYKTDGDKVILHNQRMGRLVLTRLNDGSLRGHYPIGVLRKVDAGSSGMLMAQSYPGGDEAAGGLEALMAGSILIIFLIGLAIYVYMAIALSVIARKTNHGNRWMAWVPILNIILMLNIADKPVWWFVLLLIPLVNIVFLVIVWMAISKARSKPDWWGVLIIVPILNFILPGVLAFTD